MRGGAHARRRRRQHAPADETVQKLKASPWYGGALKTLGECAVFAGIQHLIQKDFHVKLRGSHRVPTVMENHGRP